MSAMKQLKDPINGKKIYIALAARRQQSFGSKGFEFSLNLSKILLCSIDRLLIVSINSLV